MHSGKWLKFKNNANGSIVIRSKFGIVEQVYEAIANDRMIESHFDKKIRYLFNLFWYFKIILVQSIY